MLKCVLANFLATLEKYKNCKQTTYLIMYPFHFPTVSSQDVKRKSTVRPHSHRIWRCGENAGLWGSSVLAAVWVQQPATEKLSCIQVLERCSSMPCCVHQTDAQIRQTPTQATQPEM